MRSFLWTAAYRFMLNNKFHKNNAAVHMHNGYHISDADFYADFLIALTVNIACYGFILIFMTQLFYYCAMEYNLPLFQFAWFFIAIKTVAILLGIFSKEKS